MKSEILKKKEHQPGEFGLPHHYPVPPMTPDLLFFIQRNQNENTVIYEVNRDNNGLINLDLPMIAYWKQYTWGGKIKKLNYIQNKLAYGYTSTNISNELVKFNFVSYKDIDFFIVKEKPSDHYIVSCTINGQRAILKNIYVYAHELGVFPDVKFIELYGEIMDTKLPVYEKIFIEK
jgi:hypothetical protein